MQTEQINFKPEWFAGVPEEVKEIISGLLHIDLTKRMTVRKVIAHPFMQKTYDNLIKNLED